MGSHPPEMVLFVILVVIASVCVLGMAIIQTFLTGYRHNKKEPEMADYYPFHDVHCPCAICDIARHNITGETYV